MKGYWAKEAAGILKSMLEREGVGYKDLSRRLEKMGFYEEEAALRNKINRGRFQFQFFVRCVVALGNQNVSFEVRPEPAMQNSRSPAPLQEQLK